MSRRKPIDWASVHAAAFKGRIRHADLLAFGIPSSTVARRCGPGGPWEWALPGVVALSGGTPTLDEKLAAGALYAGPDAVITGLAACRLLGMERVPATDAVTYLVPHERRRRSASYAVVERTRRMPDPFFLRELAVAPIVRALVDAVTALTDSDEIRALLCEAVQRKRTTARELRRELEEGCGRGTARVRPVLAEIEDGVRSVPEARARSIATSIPELAGMLWNPSLYLADGTFLASPDGWLDTVAMAWEINSFRHHADLRSFDHTMRRQTRMTASGALVVATAPREVDEDPRGVRTSLVEGYRTALGRPRPPIRAVRAA